MGSMKKYSAIRDDEGDGDVINNDDDDDDVNNGDIDQ